MRRGLIAWSEDEVPRAALEARVARLQQAMGGAGLDAVLVYTSFPRPAGVSWLTHFVPYWSQGLLAVFGAGAPLLLVSLSKRVAGWIEETAHVDAVICTPAIGRGAAALIAERAPGTRKIGIVELARLPGGIGLPLKETLVDVALSDAGAMFAAVRHPADAPEIALSRHAAAIAARAFGTVAADGATSAGTVIAAIEGAARQDAAEEVIVAVAPDIAADTRFRRIEGAVALGARFAVRLSVAYKGHWVRLVRSFGRDGAASDAARQVDAMMARALPGLGAGQDAAAALGAAFADGDELSASGITAEACTGCAPLSPVTELPAGAVVSLALAVDGPAGPWLAGEPVVIAADGGATGRLCAE